MSSVTKLACVHFINFAVCTWSSEFLASLHFNLSHPETGKYWLDSYNERFLRSWIAPKPPTTGSLCFHNVCSAKFSFWVEIYILLFIYKWVKRWCLLDDPWFRICSKQLGKGQHTKTKNFPEEGYESFEFILKNHHCSFEDQLQEIVHSTVVICKCSLGV